jgi:hypothetical protein
VKINRELIGRACSKSKICGVQRRYHDKDCNQEQEIPRQVHETGGFDLHASHSVLKQNIK